MDSKIGGTSIQLRNRAVKLPKPQIQPVLVRNRRRSVRLSTREKNVSKVLAKERLTLPGFVNKAPTVTSAVLRKCNKNQTVAVHFNKTKPIINNNEFIINTRQLRGTLIPNINHFNQDKTLNSIPNLVFNKNENINTNLLINPTKNNLRPINDNICEDSLKQFTLTRFKIAYKTTITNIFKEITKINSGIMNGIEPTTTTRAIEIKHEATTSELRNSPIEQLLPKSKWVYLTPNKQRIRKMEELQFEEPRNLETGVLHKSKKVKTVFEVKENLQNCMDFTQFEQAQVPINTKYLKRVCSVKIEENRENISQEDFEVNQFLSANTEKSICLEPSGVFNFAATSNHNLDNSHGKKRRRTDDKNDLNWYEQHMKLLATCRPHKTLDHIDRRTFLQRKSLSFQEETTPTSHLKENKRFRSLEDNIEHRNESINEDFDTDFALLESEFYQGENTFNLSTTSSHLSNLFDNVDINQPDLHTAKFYQRKN